MSPSAFPDIPSLYISILPAETRASSSRSSGTNLGSLIPSDLYRTLSGGPPRTAAAGQSRQLNATTGAEARFRLRALGGAGSAALPLVPRHCCPGTVAQAARRARPRAIMLPFPPESRGSRISAPIASMFRWRTSVRGAGARFLNTHYRCRSNRAVNRGIGCSEK